MGTGARLGILGLMIVAIAVARLIEVELDTSRSMPPLVVQHVADEATELEGLGIEQVEATPPTPAPTEAAAPTKPAAKTATTPTYVVQPGDTLGAISKKVYGTSKRWKAILEANKDVVPKPEALRSGVELRIPEAK